MAVWALVDLSVRKGEGGASGVKSVELVGWVIGRVREHERERVCELV